jgi:hypothetical protein
MQVMEIGLLGDEDVLNMQYVGQPKMGKIGNDLNGSRRIHPEDRKNMSTEQYQEVCGDRVQPN